MNTGNPGLLPDRTLLGELLRPWKLFTFSVAMALLLYGAVEFGIADWDVGVTIVMGMLTYVCAPWTVRVLVVCLRERPPRWPLWTLAALLVALAVVDWVYFIYHTLVGNRMYRLDNFYASTPIYFMAGFFWLYRGTLRELFDNLRAVLKRPGA